MSISWRGRPIFCSTRSRFWAAGSWSMSPAPLGSQYQRRSGGSSVVTYVPEELRRHPSHGLGRDSQRPGGALSVASRRRRSPRRQDDSRGRRRGGAAVAGGPSRRDLLGTVRRPWLQAAPQVSGSGLISARFCPRCRRRTYPAPSGTSRGSWRRAWFPRRTHGLALPRESAGPWVPVIKRVPPIALSFLSTYGKATRRHVERCASGRRVSRARVEWSLGWHLWTSHRHDRRPPALVFRARGRPLHLQPLIIRISIPGSKSRARLRRNSRECHCTDAPPQEKLARAGVGLGDASCDEDGRQKSLLRAGVKDRLAGGRVQDVH